MIEAVVKRCCAVASAHEAFKKLRGQRHLVFLDSALPHPLWGKLSIVAYDPILTFTCCGSTCELQGGTIHFQAPGNPFSMLDQLARRFHCDAQHDWPLGAFIGYLGYGLRQYVEDVPSRIEDDSGAPDAWFGVYDRLLIFAHTTNEVLIVSSGVDEFGQRDANRAERRATELNESLASASEPVSAIEVPKCVLRSNFTRNGYEQAVECIREYIRAGDVYQVNLSQRFQTSIGIPPESLYERLRTANAAPFAAYLDCGGVQVLSSSPERFLSICNRLIQTRPIKGTRPRTGNVADDESSAKELLRSTKDRAELLMITDLERNDLGRVCEFGSVHVPELVTLERYETVLHLVSTVEGRLAWDVSAFDAARACFPGGSITGAPKIRAMEIIDELEPSARGVYTGSIGYFGFNDCADLNIAIRTFVHRDGEVYFHAGGGIVADSVPSLEYEETLHKARGMMRALGIETLQTEKPS